MKKFLWIYIFFFLTACSTYYKSEDGAKYVFSQPDTLVYTWQSVTDTSWSFYNELIYRVGDTIFTVQYLNDSTFDVYSNYIMEQHALRLYQYFNVYSLNIMFYEIQKDLSFSFEPQHVGKALIKFRFRLPKQGFCFHARSASVGSALDTIALGDSLLTVLRVDMRYRYVTKDRPNKKKIVKTGHISYFYYPGLGPIFVEQRDKDFHAQVISIEKLKKIGQ